MKKKQEKWCIVGLGFISQRHKDAIKSIGDELLLTCDIDPAKKADFQDFDTMIASDKFKEVDNVAILTPNYLHVPMIRKCLDAGKRVLCEKPLGLCSSEIETLPNDGRVMVVHQLRYLPLIKKLKQEPVPHSFIGMNIVMKRDEKYWNSWKGDDRLSGGLLFNLGIHYFDILIYLLGENYLNIDQMITPKIAQGSLVFDIANVSWKIAISSEHSYRGLEINGNEHVLSTKNNLSYEDLHKQVYKDFKKGIGVFPKDAIRAVRLIEKINYDRLLFQN